MTPTDKLADLKRRIDKELTCFIEHLEGDHEGKIVVDRDCFETHYKAARTLSRLIERMPADISCDPKRVMQQNNFDVGQQYHNALRQTIIDIITEEV